MKTSTSCIIFGKASGASVQVLGTRYTQKETQYTTISLLISKLPAH